MTIGTSAGIQTMERLSLRFVARIGAALLAVSALFSVLDVTTARRVSGDGRVAVIAVSLAALVLSVPTWMLPWERWNRRAMLALLPAALVLLGVGNAVNPDRFAIGIYFVIAAMWVGLAQAPGTMTVLAPAFAVAYLLPLQLAGLDDRTATRALPVVVVVSILVGESLSFVSTRLRRAHEALDEGKQRRYRALVRRSSDVIAVVSREGLIDYVSPAAHRTLGLDPDALRDTTVGEFVANHVHADDVDSLEAFSKIAWGHPGKSGTLEVRIVDDAGGIRHVEVTATNLLDDHDVQGVVLNLRNISDRKMLEAQLNHQAFHDPLCGLANRALFDDRLHQALARAERTGHTVALLFCDLDGFKSVNDTLGHREGDQMLVEIAQRLVATVRESDTVARFGGDEFAVMVEDVESVDEAVLLGERMLDALRAPVSLAGRHVTVGASIGVATATGRVPGTELVSNADVAMYIAKERGKGCVVAYQTEMGQQVRERFELAGDLWLALEREEFRLHYQPVIRLGTGEVTGLEALLRWQHPDRGLVAPLDFIPAAEESGLIVPIGRWVLQTACRDARRWRDTHPEFAALSMAVNVSVCQLRDPGLIADVADALQRADLPADALTLEITESVLLDHLEPIADRLHDLKALGVRLAVDDFGTGYSSLGYLRRHPFDVVKIDRSFVRDATTRADAAAIVRAIVDLGDALGLQTIAEGVESPDQAALLTTMACQEAQGFLYSRPVPGDQIDALLTAASAAGPCVAAGPVGARGDA